MEPVEVVGAYPTRKTIHYTVEQPGQIEPFEQTPIYAKIAGYVAAVHVEIGSCVKRGDLLAELRVPELVEEHRRKEALVVQAQLGITQAERSVKVVEKGLDLARAEIDVARAAQEKAEALLKRWESEFERMDRLVQQNVLDKQSRDEVRRPDAARPAQPRPRRLPGSGPPKLPWRRREHAETKLSRTSMHHTTTSLSRRPTNASSRRCSSIRESQPPSMVSSPIGAFTLAIFCKPRREAPRVSRCL